MFKIAKVTALIGLSSLLLMKIANAENGVHDDKIIFGQTAAIEGPASALGVGMRDGIKAAFAEVNAKGGVKGKQLILKTYDDGYEPNLAIANTEKLIKQDKVFAIIGTVGTPTTKAIEPLTETNNVPLIGAFTGAEFLRTPYKKHIVNVRGSYYQEAESWIKHLTEDMGAKKIAILYQDDSFGRAGLDGVNIALEKRGMKLAAEGKYQRNTTAVKSAVLNIKKSNPDAIVTVGAYQPVAEFIKTMRKLKVEVPIINISFVGSKALASELGEYYHNVYITQVVPFPFSSSLELVKNYQEAYKKEIGSNIEFVSLEGYMVGKLAAMMLELTNGEITRENMLNTLKEQKVFDLGGIKLKYDTSDNQGMDEVFITKIAPNLTFESVTKISK
jgi:ABC-type branched-subunit amino acid transport system substrate-binding protein